MKNNMHKKAFSVMAVTIAAGLTAMPHHASMAAEIAERSAINEVIVTAQRREQNLSEVPISVTALGADFLKNSGVEGTRDLTMVTPGLNFATQGAFSQPTIRGIGTSDATLGASSNVALYVDGVYNPMMLSGNFNFNNIERIEVLKGPQGTLFGRNATGGAIQVITRSPRQESEVELEARFGSDNLMDYKFYATGGLTDTIAADIALMYLEDDGYARNVFLDTRAAERELRGVRSKILMEPSDNVELVLTLASSKSKDATGNTLQHLKGGPPLSPYALDPDMLSVEGSRRIVHRIRPSIETEVNEASLKATVEMGELTLTSVSAWSDRRGVILVDSDSTPLELQEFTIGERNEAIQQEFTLSGNSGNFDWIAGAFYLDDEHDRPFLLLHSLGGEISFPKDHVKVDAWAVFGESTYSLTDKTSVTVGARYSVEKRDVPQFSERWEDFSPRVSLLHALSDNTNIYVTYSEGFKSGTFSNGQPVKPETLKAWELGFKSSPTSFMNISASAYYYDYEDIQVQANINQGSIITQLQNAAVARIQGVDIEAQMVLAESLNMRLGAAWTDAEYKDFPNAIAFEPAEYGNTAVQGGRDASGNRMIRTPEWTLHAGMDYSTNVMDGELHLSGNLFVTDGFFWDVSNRLKENGYTLLNAKAAWTPRDSRVTFSVWGDNLLNETYGIYVAENVLGDRIAYGRPRTAGVGIAFRWH